MESKRPKLHLTELQIKLIDEMKEQGADRPTVNGIMARLKTIEQQEEMLNFLISIREKDISKSEVILKSMEIVGMVEKN